MELSFTIQNMVCPRCIEAVQDVFEKNHSSIVYIELGFVVIEPLENFNATSLKTALENRGFNVIKDKEVVLTEKIKIAIIELIFYDEINKNLKNSIWLEKHLAVPYQKLSKAFSKQTNTTIEKYIICQKIEKAKELVCYGELSFEEISKKLNYKNLSHLSAQFKLIEGVSLTKYCKNQIRNRKFLDNV